MNTTHPPTAAAATATTNELYAGLDYHQHQVQVCLLDGDGRVVANAAVADDWAAIAALASRHGPIRRAAVEACNGAADLADDLAAHAGWSVDLAHAAYVARLKGSPDKTDYTDARLLADLTRVGYLPRAWHAPAWVRELRRLVRYRQQQVQAKRAAKVRVSGLLRDHRATRPPALKPWTKGWRQWLTAPDTLPAASAWVVRRQLAQIAFAEQELRLVEAELWAYTAGDPLTARLMTLRGVGPVTAWVLRAEVGRFDRFRSGKALSRFCGLTPRNASSGGRQADAGLVRAGSELLRATLVELAHRLTRIDARWRSLKRRLVDAGKPGSVAAAAVANRWVRWMYHRMVEPPTPAGPTPALN